MKQIILSIILFISASAFSAKAQNDPYEIIKGFKTKMDKIESYSADILIKVDVDFIKIKDRKAKVKFTKPDKFEFEAEGFALLPKNGIQMEYMKMVEEDYTALLVGEETIDEHKTKLIKIIPNKIDGDIILAEMWIDPQSFTIYKMKTYSKTSGTYTIRFKYNGHPYNLPDMLSVEFEVKNQKLPTTFTGDIENIGEKLKQKDTKGMVYITYSNYKVNQ